MVKNHYFEEVYFVFVHLHHLESRHASLVEEHLLERFYLLLLLRVARVDTAAWLLGAKSVSGLLHLVLEHQDHRVNISIVDFGPWLLLWGDLLLLLLDLSALRIRNFDALKECFDLLFEAIARSCISNWLLILV